MPVDAETGGQLYTFAVEQEEDLKVSKYIWIPVRVGDTIQRIASRRGHPERASLIARLNRVHSVRSVLLHRPHKKGDRTRVRIPGLLKQADRFHVLAGKTGPKIVDGYAKFEKLDRPTRTGLTIFTGYDPVQMTVPVKFEAVLSRETEAIERDMSLLERMAGRGQFAGAARGEPAVIRISTTNSKGYIVPLIPRNYQWSEGNPHAPVWRITNIEWADEENDPLRGPGGERLRQSAVITVQQHTDTHVATRSAAQRSKAKRTAK